MQTDAQVLGPALRLLRARRRLRQYQVAERAGITKAMLSSYENGGTTPSFQSLKSLLGALDSDLAGLQQALDMISGVRPLEEQSVPTPSDDAPLEDGGKVIEVRIPRLGEALALLERIAQALEGAPKAETEGSVSGKAG